MAQITIRGSVISGDGSCGGAGGSGAQCAIPIGFGQSCFDGGLSYEAVLPGKTVISTSGSLGDEFVALDVLDSLSAVEFLMVQSTGTVRLRIGAKVAVASAIGASYPTGFAGGETLDWTLDGDLVPVTFFATDQSVDQVAARINAAAALAGKPTPLVTVVSGQLQLSGIATGPDGSHAFAGTAAAALGLDAPSIAPSEGGDVDINGLALLQFPRYPNAPARIDASGNASIQFLAAGKAS